MSEEKTAQAVVDNAETQPKAGSEAADARGTDDLDQLLADFDAKAAPGTSQTQQTEQKGAPAADIGKLADEIRELKNQGMREKIEQQYNHLVEKIHEDTKASPRLIRGFIEDLGKENPKLASLYFGAKTDAERAKIIASVTKEFRKELKSSIPETDERATEDREAVTAAVRNASTRAPEGKAPDFSRLTDAEFAKEKDALFG